MLYTRVCLVLCLLLTACSWATVSPTPQPASPTPTAAAPAALAPGQTVPPAAATVAPATAPSSDELAMLDAARRQPRDKVALANALGPCRTQPGGCPLVSRTTPLEVTVGQVENFWVNDIAGNRNYEISATLRYAGPVVLMYVENGAEVNQAGLEQAARNFEQQIYPRTRALFGSEAQPGVDGDNRITILNGRGPGGGVLGYFSSRDAVPKSVNRFSNEREMFFMNVEALPPGSDAYLDTLAHEFQHMIHQHEGPGSPIWFNEGNSTLSQDLNGFVGQGYAQAYLQNPGTQLNAWSDTPGASIAHYGAAHLFMRYVYAQYAGESGLLPLVRADAGDNLEAFTELARQQRPDIASFADLYADWAVANLLNDGAVGDGRYSYGSQTAQFLPATVQPQRMEPGERSGVASQFGVTYVQLPGGPTTLEFAGATEVNLVGERPQGQFAWWSGRGDNSVATLSRQLDLGGLTEPKLRFKAWYELEAGYDYAFASISADGGRTWATLPGSSTTDDDPQGVNFGNGLNGVSGAPGKRTSDGVRGQWVDEEMDLSAYAGQQVLLRFWQTNDEGFNAPGLLLDDVSVCDASRCAYQEQDTGDADGWQSEGFSRVDGTLPQRWALRLVRTAADGSVRVEPLAVDGAGRAQASLATGERGVLVIAAVTPHTTEQTTYRVTVR